MKLFDSIRLAGLCFSCSVIICGCSQQAASGSGEAATEPAGTDADGDLPTTTGSAAEGAMDSHTKTATDAGRDSSNSDDMDFAPLTLNALGGQSLSNARKNG